MTRGGKREGAGRKSRGLPTGKVSTYLEDREELKSISKQINLPTVELIHQILKHKLFKQIIEDISQITDWHKKD